MTIIKKPSNTRHRSGPTRITTERTIEKPASNLDARSVVALEWVQHWVQRHTSLKVPAPVVIRRALVALADRLSHLPSTDIAAEGQVFRDAARGCGSAITLTEARARMERHVQTPGLQPMAHWLDMLYSIEERRTTLDMLERLEAVLAEGGA
jgi:hypothetical protein